MVVSGGGSAPVPQLVACSLDEIPLPVQSSVVFPRLLAVALNYKPISFDCRFYLERLEINQAKP